MKLIKLTDDHYVVVDDSEIKEGDWYIDDTLQILQALPPRKDWINSGKNGHIICKKITHSTQPVDNVNGFPAFIVGDVQQLYLQEVKELIGEVKVDIEKKALENFTEPLNKQGEKRTHPPVSRGLFGFNKFKKAFRKGYYQALEDNKEKKYTQQELIWAIQEAYGHGQNDEFDGVNKIEESIKAITKHLQPKTEWEVCFVDNKLKLK